MTSLFCQVVFAEGLVQFKGQWYLYFGQADSTIGVAMAETNPNRPETLKLVDADDNANSLGLKSQVTLQP